MYKKEKCKKKDFHKMYKKLKKNVNHSFSHTYKKLHTRKIRTHTHAYTQSSHVTAHTAGVVLQWQCSGAQYSVFQRDTVAESQGQFFFPR